MKNEKEVLKMLETVEKNKSNLQQAENFERINREMEIEVDVLKWILEIK